MLTTPRAAALAALILSGAIPVSTALAQANGRRPAVREVRMHTTTQFPIPESMRHEHAEIHEALERATQAPGRVGDAASELAQLLHPHFVREEQIALPPLALLAPLARGEASAGMREVLPMTDSLRAELPRMLEEHRAIRAATLRMGEVATREGNEAVAALARQLALHAQSEEELFYPAAVLVGDLVRARTGMHEAP